MQDEECVCCAILAGGKSERLANKPFLPLNGKPLVFYAVDAADGFFEDVLIIAKKEQAERIKGTIENKKQTRLITENSSDFSPWNGIRAAIDNTDAEWVFLLACDMPFVCAELFDLLVSKINPNIDCVIPETDRLQPLCALYRRSALKNARGEGSITRFADSLKKEVVRIANAKWLFNINTKEDFEKAGKMMRI